MPIVKDMLPVPAKVTDSLVVVAERVDVSNREENDGPQLSERYLGVCAVSGPKTEEAKSRKLLSFGVMRRSGA